MKIQLLTSRLYPQFCDQQFFFLYVDLISELLSRLDFENLLNHNKACGEYVKCMVFPRGEHEDARSLNRRLLKEEKIFVPETLTDLEQKSLESWTMVRRGYNQGAKNV